MRRITPFLLLCVLVGVQASCDRKQEEPIVVDFAEAQERLIEANRNRVRAERNDIDSYIASKSWPVDTTGTGMRYWINHRGQGPAAQPGMVAQLEYTVALLNDSVMYDSETNGLLTFNIGQDFVETGLHEAMLYLRQGDSAKVVLPSHLAHGLTGDFGRIPGNAPVVYELYVKSLR